MDEQPVVPASQPEPTMQPPAPKSPRKKWLIIAVAALTLVVVTVGVIILGVSQKQTKSPESDTAATAALFSSLEKAASKPMLRVAMLHKTFATKADLDANTKPGIVQSSVSEIDSTAGQYGHVFAQKLNIKDEFSMERCINKQAYISASAIYTNRPLPKTLAAAQEYLGQLYASNGTFVACPNLGLVPQAVPEIAPARLTDSVMPVTLTATQAANWKNKVLAAKLFVAKDEGMVSRNGKQLKKYSFTPRDDRTDVNSLLYDLFYQAAEIDTVKRETPQAKWEYSFIPINPSKTGSVKGFYLIDEAVGLPVYSEIQGVNPDRTEDTETNRLNIGFHKTTYAYPSALSLDTKSPLEILE